MLSVVIPSYNEERNIPLTAKRLSEILGQAGIEYELIFVDDGSVDGTFAAIGLAQRAVPQVRGVRFSRNFGKEPAIMAGLAAAKGDCCAVIDCDLQHPPECLPRMHALWQEGYMIVEGVKASRGQEGRVYKHLAKLFYRLFGRFLGLDLSRASDYKLLDRRVVDLLLALPEKTMFFRGLSVYFGFRRAEVEFEVAPRQEGETKWSFSGLFCYAVNSITSFTAMPLQLITGLGLIMLTVFAVLGIQTLYNYLTGNAVEGFTTVILLLLFIGSTLSISLGIIGHYIAKIYEEIKGRPMYVVEKTI